MLAFVALALMPLIGFQATEPPEVPESPAAALSLEPGPPRPLPQWVPLPEDAPFAPLPAPAQHSIELATAVALATALALAAAARRRPTVDEAYAAVRDHLQDNFFSDVVRGDLVAVSETLAGLSPAGADAVVGRMTDRELGVWLREMDGWNGSLSEAEEAAIFLLLGSKLSAGNLVRLAAAGKTAGVVEAVAVAAPPAVQAEFVAAALPVIEGHEAGMAAMAAGWSEPVLAGFVDRLTPAALFAALVTPATVRSWQPDRPHTLLVYDSTAFVDLLRATAALDDPQPKAALFVAAAAGLSDIDAGVGLFHGSVLREREVLLGAMALLLRSDPDEIMGLLNHRLDPHGNATAHWAAAMIENGLFDELHGLLRELQGPDPLARFTTPGPDPADPYPHASNLGYFAGVLHLAIDDMTDRTADQIDLLGAIFGEVAGLVPSKGADLPVGFLVDRVGEAVVSDLAAGAATLQQTIWRLAKPRTPQGDLWNGAGTTQFQDAWEEVVAVR